MQISRVDTAPQDVETLPNWLVADWLRLMELARGENCRSRQRRGPPRSGEIKVYPRMRTPCIPLQLQQPGDESRDRPGQCRPASCVNPNLTG